MKKAKALIQAVKGRELSHEDRALQAIELAALILSEAHAQETSSEKRQQKELSLMIDEPTGRLFTMNLTDQCFRSKNSWRVADQIQFLMERFGIPQYLSAFKKWQFKFFKASGHFFAPIFVPIIKWLLHKECRRFILPGDRNALTYAIRNRLKDNLRINLNHVGEAILGEEEAHHRLNVYMEDLRRPEVEYISVKISTLFSQLNLIAWNETLAILKRRLKLLLQVAYANDYIKPDGTHIPKFVNLDMEEYRDLDLTVELFKSVLDDPVYLKYSAGIVLQAYLPNSYLIQQDLTVWARQRVARGGAPIKIRIVKGANLAMEQVEASLHGWPQAPYMSKKEVDANFKRMLIYACQKEHAQAAYVGIGSHNLFDIAYGLLLRTENEVEENVSFEMLEGMNDPLRRVIQKLASDLLLYCPAVTKNEFHNTVAYLIRRLDENTDRENFMRYVFKMQVGSHEWQEQADMFLASNKEIKNTSLSPRRSQNRFYPSDVSKIKEFENEEDTDWSLSQNRQWAHKILEDWSQKARESVPLVIGNKIYQAGNEIEEKKGFNPSDPQKVLYTYALAKDSQVEEALKTAIQAHSKWSHSSLQQRSEILRKVAHELRLHRADLIGAMVADTGKIVSEADVEVSEAIDFLEYYRENMFELNNMQGIKWHSKGPVLVTPPWNFPCSIPTSGIAAALAAGNSVIFKPAPEAVWVGWTLAQQFWEAGVGKDVLQFINCADEPYGSHLVQDPRIALVVLTGSTSTAKHFLKIRPNIDLIAETGGKNAIIVSDMADRDQAIKDIIQSAFGHSGQKCSACSLVICLAEVYDDPQFRRQLRDGAASLPVGIPWNPATRINPLIHPPEKTLRRGLTQLEEGEEWLLKPKQDSNNPSLWSPGIKLGVSTGNFTQQNELFGPVLGLIRANNLEHAIQIANQTNYGLTSGLHSLDLREQKYWAEHIEAGNCYINRGITGAIVQRQPFGGWKESSFSPGAKAGGPNYLMQFMRAEEILLPKEKKKLSEEEGEILKNFSEEEQNLYSLSRNSYAFYWKHYFNQKHDPSLVQGEDNFFLYVPRKKVNLRVAKGDNPIDIQRALAAGKICGCEMIVSREETDQQFLERVKDQSIKQVRFFSQPSPFLSKALAEMGCYMIISPVLANGRLELLHYLKEQSLSISYHRYGNLGERENEVRHPIK